MAKTHTITVQGNAKVKPECVIAEEGDTIVWKGATTAPQGWVVELEAGVPQLFRGNKRKFAPQQGNPQDQGLVEGSTVGTHKYTVTRTVPKQPPIVNDPIIVISDNTVLRAAAAELARDARDVSERAESLSQQATDFAGRMSGEDDAADSDRPEGSQRQSD